jgi:hypothetical protein
MRYEAWSNSEKRRRADLYLLHNISKPKANLQKTAASPQPSLKKRPAQAGLELNQKANILNIFAINS